MSNLLKFLFGTLFCGVAAMNPNSLDKVLGECKATKSARDTKRSQEMDKEIAMGLCGSLPSVRAIVRHGDPVVDCGQRVASSCDQEVDLAKLGAPPFEGSCHLLENPWVGSVSQPHHRFFKKAKADQFENHRFKQFNLGMEARNSSEKLVNQKMHPILSQNFGRWSQLILYASQFLDHDSFRTAHENKEDCTCFSNLGNSCHMLSVPPSFKSPMGSSQKCMPMVAHKQCIAEFGGHAGTEASAFSETSMWIDLSQVYGTSLKESKTLKMPGDTAKLAAGDDGKGNGFLAFLPESESQACDESSVCRCLVTGDFRASENPGLTTMHVAYVSMHNFLVDTIREIDGVSSKKRTNDQYFQLARRLSIVGWQHTVESTLMPDLMGRQWYDLLVNSSGWQDEAGSDLISLPLSTAMFRLHHMITPNLYGKQSAPKFTNTVQNLEILADRGVAATLTDILKPYQDKQSLMSRDISNALPANRNFNLDLGAINIGRTILHGLPNFGEYQRLARRQWEAAGVLSHGLAETQTTNFCQDMGSLDDMDVFTGSRCEGLTGDGIMGPTSSYFMARFLRKNRKSRYHYLNLPTDSIIRSMGTSLTLQVALCAGNPNTLVGAQPFRNINRRDACNSVLIETKQKIQELMEGHSFPSVFGG